MGENLTQALILLLAGFIVVFVVLILLIVVVTLYSKIITSVQKGTERKKKKKEVVQVAAPMQTSEPKVFGTNGDEDEIPGEIIAVIAAAVDAVYGEKPHKLRSVRKSRPARSPWARAGAVDSTRPF